MKMAPCGTMTQETADQQAAADRRPATRDQLRAAVMEWHLTRPGWVAEYELLTGWRWWQMPDNMLADLLHCVAWRTAYGRPTNEFLQLERPGK